MKLECVHWSDVPDIWPKVSEWISAALAHGGGGYTLEDIYSALLTKQMQLWLIGPGEPMACAVTQLAALPRVRICDILAVGGVDLKAWEHLIGDLEAWALERGCDETRAHGRLGWKPYAKRFGYDPLHLVYRKKLR